MGISFILLPIGPPSHIALHGLQVEKIARDCFFHLAKSVIFDESTFGNFGDQYIQKPMQISRPVSYIFDMHPPSDIQFGDYSTALRKSLDLDP